MNSTSVVSSTFFVKKKIEKIERYWYSFLDKKKGKSWKRPFSLHKRIEKTVDRPFVVSSCVNTFGINTTIYFELALKLYYSFSASPSLQISVRSIIASRHKEVLVLRHDLVQYKSLSWLSSNDIHVVKIIKFLKIYINSVLV
jgi:hypothetical protein